jgi:class 3 adenylate cyclase
MVSFGASPALSSVVRLPNPSYNISSVGLRDMVQEQPVRVERRLSGILAADVAGYSRLMGLDEEATHTKLSSLMTNAVHPAIAEHGGQHREEHRRWLLGGVYKRR